MRTISTVRRTVLILSLVTASLGTCVKGVRAQSFLDYLDPNADRTIYALAFQEDGKILVGGSFSSIGGELRNCIARLDPVTGRADSFNARINNYNEVRCIVVQPDGKIIVAGRFTIDGQIQRYVARLDPQTGRPDSFNPNPDYTVNSVAIDQDGKILVGGDFTQIGGQPRNRIARLDPVTGAADSFNPNADDSIKEIVVQRDGKILAAGNFTQIGGLNRSYLARIDPETGLADTFNPGPNNSVSAIAVQSDGKVLAGGTFTKIGGQVRQLIARLDATTGLADAFNPGLTGPGVFKIVLQADDGILVGGNFWTTGFWTTGGISRHCIARLWSNGRYDSLNPNVNNPYWYGDETIWAIAVQADERIVIGGVFSTVDRQPRSNIARLLSTEAFAPTPAPTAFVNGKIAFHKEIGGFQMFQICTVNPDGTGFRQLTNSVFSSGGSNSPSWSPDGTKIAFAGWGNVFVPPSPWPVARHDIYVMNADGSNQVRLTNSTDTFGNYNCPAWSPNSNKIAFSKIPNSSGSGADTRYQIFVLGANGGEQTRLTNNVDSSSYYPAWSPNGRQIAFVRDTSETRQICVMDFDGRNQRQLTNFAGYHDNPSWSPDGTMIIYSRGHNPSRSDHEIYMMHADGKNPTALTGSEFGGNVNPVWSPDGRRIAFNNGSITLMDPDGSNSFSLQQSGMPSGSSWQRLPANHRPTSELAKSE